MTLNGTQTKMLLSVLSGVADTLELLGYDVRSGDFDEAGSLLLDLAQSVGNLETMLSEAAKSEIPL